MKTRVKGNRVQRKAIQQLEIEGYLVDKVEVGGKFAKSKDLFGLFDLVALHKNTKPSFIQVTCNRPHTHKKYLCFSLEYPMVNIIQMVWYDRKGWKIFNYDNGTKKVYDGRK